MNAVARERSDPEAVDAAYAPLDQQSPWRHVSIVSAEVRRYALHQIPRIQFAFALGVALILAAEWVRPTVPLSATAWWAAGAAANLATRVLLIQLFATRKPEIAAQHRWWRLVPISCVVLASLHWLWTSLIYVRPGDSLTTDVVLLVYLMLGIAAMGYAPASRVPAVAHVVCIWLPLPVLLWPDDSAQIGVFAVGMFAMVSVIIVVSYFTSAQLWLYSMRAAEVSRLLSELKVSNAELSRLREAADRHLQERSMFFAAASHDLGQRLHGLKLLASAASSVGHTADAVVTRRMQEALAELDHYARHILDFAHLESGDYPVVLQRVFLQDLFQQIALNFEANADEHGIELRVRTCNFELVCDPRLLLRVLENFVANAIKFSRKGVLLAARRRAGACCIEVWDQGPGVPSDALAEIFKPFCRLPDGAEQSARGVGLGLATARRLAELQGMHIGVRSTLGRGTVFSVGRQV